MYSNIITISPSDSQTGAHPCPCESYNRADSPNQIQHDDNPSTSPSNEPWPTTPHADTSAPCPHHRIPRPPWLRTQLPDRVSASHRKRRVDGKEGSRMRVVRIRSLPPGGTGPVCRRQHARAGAGDRRLARCGRRARRVVRGGRNGRVRGRRRLRDGCGSGIDGEISCFFCFFCRVRKNDERCYLSAPSSCPALSSTVASPIPRVVRRGYGIF